ncbi:hypothetical protein [Gracilibacillus suaedae]|uniref:hypothetical protein n=1 Tax=Gracilibacillus suaedae TaxID=2820273 RepID=UPI001ABDEB4F|nr:hypothetical protein [Gracilibacillus suaedae]
MAKIENMASNGGYIIDVKTTTKTIYMKIVGTFTSDQAEQFHLDYRKQISIISTIDYILEVDCRDMKVINQDMIPKLIRSYELYKESNYKKIVFLVNDNKAIQVQLNQVAQSIDLPNYQIIRA